MAEATTSRRRLPSPGAGAHDGDAPLRWLLLPLGICALVAVGVHAAADRVDDMVLRAVDAVDALFDAGFASFSLTAPLVDLVGLEERTAFARGLALAWELAADLVIALPMLGYETPARPLLRTRELLERARARPTQLRVVRPVAVALVCLAGACAVADLLRARVFLGLRGALGSAAGPLSRIAAALALLAALGIAGHAVLRALEHADDLSERKARTRRAAVTVGLIGSAIALPLAIVALLQAAPLLSFFR